MRESSSASDIARLSGFLRCPTPDAWVDNALADIDLLLQDHASLELKAAQQAQKLIFRYAALGNRVGTTLADAFRSRLSYKMSRLAREELRHFEQVTALIESRGGNFLGVSPSRYAAALHELARSEEPGALVDSLVIGAVIEARSCERFFCLVEPLAEVDPKLARFYASLLRAEARHFEDYLELARAVAGGDAHARLELFLARDAELVAAPDAELRFLSGPLPATTRSR